MEVIFYQLSDANFEKILLNLIQKSLTNNWNIEIRFHSIIKLNNFNDYLWTFEKDSFLVHATEEDNFLEQQKILLSLDNNKSDLVLDDKILNRNSAKVFFCIGGSTPPLKPDYEKIIIIFYNDGGEEYDRIKKQWYSYKDNNIPIKCYVQNENRKWIEKNL
ncbi:DNA polymerase III subunit chi [Bartonella sp. DGB1]|uniref:DNA polymerase III subunit chi n=1 Tax=Bartonella sp. DGB1 TaxID=3239807 RepID=UPI003525B1CF